MKNHLFKKIFLPAVVALPIVASLVFSGASIVQAADKFRPTGIDETACAELSGAPDIKTFSDCLVDLVTTSFVPYIFALTILAFSVGIFNYIKNSDDESKRTESVKLIVWSLVGLLFMTGVWAFAAMFAQFWGVSDAPDQLLIPQFK